MAEIFLIGNVITGFASTILLYNAVKHLLSATSLTDELLFVWMKFFFMFILFMVFSCFVGWAYREKDGKLKIHDSENPKLEKQRPSRRTY